MDDVLLSYYNRELNYIRKSGAEFSEKYPKIAGRLRIDKDTVEDPHVSRLIESFAFLTARIRHSLDDNFPELTEALMGVLYPDYHAPLPSMSIIEFSLLPHLQQKLSIPRGEEMRVEGLSGEVCHYKTCADTTVLPALLSGISYNSLPFKAPVLPGDFQKGASIQSILKLKVEPMDESSPFDFEENKLRFYINAQPDIGFDLYEMLLNHSLGVAIARDAFDETPVFLDSSSISACGFDESEQMIDIDGRSSSAHRLLAEYFLLPQKFLFTEINGLNDVWQQYPEGFHIYIYCDAVNTDLIKGVDERSLKLGCAPMVNLFDSVSEPIQAAELGSEVMLRTSGKGDTVTDIHSIKEVYAINPQGEKKVIQPFYGGYHLKKEEDAIYWSIRRENSLWQNGVMSRGTDIYINFVDVNYQTVSPDSSWIINADVSCTNRDQPNKLPFGPNQPLVSFSEGGAGLRVNCLLPPTTTVLPKLDDATRWQLVSQLSLQHFSSANGLEKLKEVLTLYNFHESKEIASLIDGMVDLKAEVSTARIINNGRSAMCQGTHFIMTCDEGAYAGNGLYLFGVMIDEFLSQFCAINTFTQLTIKTTRHAQVEFEWPPRTGCQPLV